jgi:predicted nucleic acid-binding protein
MEQSNKISIERELFETVLELGYVSEELEKAQKRIKELEAGLDLRVQELEQVLVELKRIK